ncbi:MAG TPA: glutathionylspermidine synthase family protein, partial [Pseudoneobacillus sp.]|nr:glutathionylspermidine synthase family protein [Pseudoneobacillus sp.]
FFKTAKFLRYMSDDVLQDLGFPVEVLPFLRSKLIGPETIISRFDFVKKDNQIKMLEFNSDTPTFIKECFFINEKVSNHFGKNNPNKGEINVLKNAITKSIVESLKKLEITHIPNIVFTAHDDHLEDWLTCKFLSDLIPIPNKLIPLNQLELIDDALVDSDGIPIDILYRQTYPLEHLIEDKDENDKKIGLELLKLVNAKKIALINPISAFLLQSKAIQAFIWGLRENRSFFNEEESYAITTYMLPTFLEPDTFIGTSTYVEKPVFGREGDTVTIFDQNGKVILQDSQCTYKKELQIYQKYEELPTLSLETNKGLEQLSYLFGSFFIAGNPSAIGIRAGGKITANESYFLPIGIHL